MSERPVGWLDGTGTTERHGTVAAGNVVKKPQPNPRAESNEDEEKKDAKDRVDLQR